MQKQDRMLARHSCGGTQGLRGEAATLYSLTQTPAHTVRIYRMCNVQCTGHTVFTLHYGFCIGLLVSM